MRPVIASTSEAVTVLESADEIHLYSFDGEVELEGSETGRSVVRGLLLWLALFGSCSAFAQTKFDPPAPLQRSVSSSQQFVIYHSDRASGHAWRREPKT